MATCLVFPTYPCRPFQDAAARTIFTYLHWFPVRYRTAFKVLVLVYKSRNGFGSKYISDMLEECRLLWSLGSSQLEVPRVKTKHHVGFSHYAADRMNQLLDDPEYTPIVATFKSKLKTSNFSYAFDWLYSLVHFYFPYYIWGHLLQISFITVQ